MFQTQHHPTLNVMQQKALSAMQMGKNVLITGSGGTGKTYLLNVFQDWIRQLNVLKTGITSTTGVSALLIDGITIHSWAGIGHGVDTAQFLAKKIQRDKKCLDRWTTVNILIIDEISMMSPDLFDKLDTIARILRNNEKPFGGIQLLLTGDFCQLSPVDRTKKDTFYCFEAKCWTATVEKIFHLTEIVRQKDKQFQKTLNNIRMGRITPSDKALLMSRVNQPYPEDMKIKPTQLFARKDAVERHNLIALAKLKSQGQPSKVYKAKISIENKNPAVRLTEKQREFYIDLLHRHCQTPNVVEFAIGSQVMLICNLDLERGFANGTRGVVTDLTDFGPTVLFKNGANEVIQPWKWTVRMKDEGVEIAKLQIPLILADATTIHKSQGATIDCLSVNLGPSMFECGQTYTALSRVRSLDGLYITEIDFSKILVHPKVYNFYNSIKES